MVVLVDHGLDHRSRTSHRRRSTVGVCLGQHLRLLQSVHPLRRHRRCCIKAPLGRRCPKPLRRKHLRGLLNDLMVMQVVVVVEVVR